MNSVHKTLYIPLYGKAFVSRKNIILRDKKAEEIWEKEGFALRGKSKSKWLAYYMAMRSAVYDGWLEDAIHNNRNAAVLHIGCGLDNRIGRVSAPGRQWYDIDFPEVIEERRKYYAETECCHMLAADMREDAWKQHIRTEKDAIVVLEGISMYFAPEELSGLLSGLSAHFASVRILMDCYTETAAKMSKYKNPVKDVGVTAVYGYDHPEELAERAGLVFVREHCMTPPKYIDELRGAERAVFKNLFAGKIAGAMYRMYEYKKV